MQGGNENENNDDVNDANVYVKKCVPVIDHLDKTYHLKNADVHAVDDVSLHIESGQIYGVIGYSGAGKSTLVRCLNFLEIPDSGSIEIEGFGKVSAIQGSLDISQKKL